MGTVFWARGSSFEASLLAQAGGIHDDSTPSDSLCVLVQLMWEVLVWHLVVRAADVGAMSALGGGMLMWEAFGQTSV